MRKMLTAGLLSMAALSVQAQDAGFEITGNLSDIQNEKVYLLQRTASGMDTLAQSAVENGSFVLKGEVSEPVMANLITGPRQGLAFFVENANISVSGTTTDHEIKGSASQDEYDKLSNLSPELTDLQKQFADLSAQYRAAAAKNDTATIAALKLKAEGLGDDYEAADKEYKKLLVDYLQTQPASYVTPHIISRNYYSPDPSVFLPIYEKFPANVKKTAAAQQLKARLDALAATAVGQEAPEITGTTPDGETISLSKAKGKVTLIDFWASWCGPCRAENPNVVKVYNKYHDKGFNIFGVSLDEDGEKWKKAIADDGLIWKHVSDLKGWGSELSKPYAVRAIPYTVLIDAEGKIVATNLRGDALEAKVAELLGE